MCGRSCRPQPADVVVATADAVVEGGRTGEMGDGKILVLPVDSVIRTARGPRLRVRRHARPPARSAP
ncbi:MAG TPA: P-II family nitrogen regulator [Gaiellaceae bacterium]|nr:P-II family nitrogen regulator [Gaiellaceae bacterium]